MTRPNLNSVRRDVAVNAMHGASHHDQQRYKRAIVYSEACETGDARLQSALEQPRKLKAKFEAAKDQGQPFARKRSQKRRGTRKDFGTTEGFNDSGILLGRSYASIAGARMEAKKAGFPDVTRHPTTIDLCIEPLTGNLESTTAIQRKIMRKRLVGFSSGYQIEGMFSYVIKPAAELAHTFPPDLWPDGFDPIQLPDELFAMFHWHGDISDPHLSKRQVRQIVKKAFPGSGRVCVRRVQPEREDKNGQKTHGGQGYLEYAAMDKTEIKVTKPEQIRKANVGHAMLGTTWSKRNRTFSMGKPLLESGTVIDPERVELLQMAERLETIKRNKHKGGYAEWFLHAWMSGVIKVVRKPSVWPQLGTSIASRVLASLVLLRNWCNDEGPDAPCFIEYTDALLE